MKREDFVFIFAEIVRLNPVQQMLVYDLHEAAQLPIGSPLGGAWAKVYKFEHGLNEIRKRDCKEPLKLLATEGSLTPIFHQFLKTCIAKIPAKDGKGYEFKLELPPALRDM